MHTGMFVCVLRHGEFEIAQILRLFNGEPVVRFADGVCDLAHDWQPVDRGGDPPPQKEPPARRGLC